MPDHRSFIKEYSAKYLKQKYGGQYEADVSTSDNPLYYQDQRICYHQHSSVKEELIYSRHALDHNFNPYGGSETPGDQPKNKMGRKDLDSFEGAIKAAESRWPYGIKKFSSAMRKVEHAVLPSPIDMRRRPRFDPWEGDEVDRDRLYAGMDFWRGPTTRKLSNSNTICIVVNCSSPWQREGEEIMWRGIAGTLIADQLEDSGYRVELWACRAGTDTLRDAEDYEDIDCYTATLVKDSSQPLNWPIMINTMTGWYYRTITWLSFFHEGYEAKGNLGYPINELKPWQCALLLRKDIEPDIDLHQQGIVLVEDVWDEEAALKLASEILGKFTGEELYASAV